MEMDMELRAVRCLGCGSQAMINSRYYEIFLAKGINGVKECKHCAASERGLTQDAQHAQQGLVSEFLDEIGKL